MRGHQERRALEQRAADALPFAGGLPLAQGGLDRDDAEHGAEDVDDRGTGAERLAAAKKPAAKPPRPLVWSPRGAGSTFTTSAPSSASTRPAVGPITVWLNSKTFSPVRGVADIRQPCAGTRRGCRRGSARSAVG